MTRNKKLKILSCFELIKRNIINYNRKQDNYKSENHPIT